jgi:hypothetical protein
LRWYVRACLCLGGLHQAVDALDQAIGDSAVEPPQDAMPMMFDGAGGIDHRRQPAVGGPEVPFLQEARAGFGRGLVVEVLAGCLVSPAGGPTGWPDCAAIYMACATQHTLSLLLGPPHLIDGIVDDLDGMEFVEGHGRIR